MQQSGRKEDSTILECHLRLESPHIDKDLRVNSALGRKSQETLVRRQKHEMGKRGKPRRGMLSSGFP